MRRSERLAVAALALGALAVGGVPARAAEETLLAEEAAAIVPVTGEHRVVVRGIVGAVALQKAEHPDEVRILSVTGDAKRDPLPVAVWSDGTTLRIAARAGSEATPHELQVFLPDGFDAVVEAHDSRLQATELPGSVDVKGINLDVDVHGVHGGVVADLQGGRAGFEGIGSALNLHAKGVEVTVNGVEGDAALTLIGGNAEVVGVTGEVHVDFDGAGVRVKGSDNVTIRGKKGRLDLQDTLTAHVSLSESPMTLARARGEVEVQSDSEVRFTDCQTALSVDGFGASVRGVKNDGLVEVKTHNAEINMESVDGPVHVEGDGLKIRLKDVGGETLLYTKTSDIEVIANQAQLGIENDQGDVTVRQSIGPVQLTARGGTVRLLDVKGSVELHADSKEVEVAFAAVGGAEDSVLDNAGGDMTVRFPPTTSCRVEARSKFGKVESDLEHVIVGGSGDSATGLIGTAPQRTVNVTSGWNIHLTGGPAAEARP